MRSAYNTEEEDRFIAFQQLSREVLTSTTVALL
jgi:hypothetical protein